MENQAMATLPQIQPGTNFNSVKPACHTIPKSEVEGQTMRIFTTIGAQRHANGMGIGSDDFQ